MSHESPPLPFLLFEIQGTLYAINSRQVREIILRPEVIPVPGVPPECAGVINLRGKVMKLIDLRIKIGLPSARADMEALVRLLHEREQDHLNWLNELEACVRESRPFQLARDPHACKFGRWYDQFQTENTLLKMVLEKMNAPHQAIHACAARILALAEAGKIDEALSELNTRRDRELAELVELFGQARQLFRDHHRELVVVLEQGKNRFAITIDRVESVERIPEENMSALPPVFTASHPSIADRVARRNKTNDTLFLLEAEHLFLNTLGRSNPPESPLADIQQPLKLQTQSLICGRDTGLTGAGD